MNGSNLPRADIGTGALAGAITALIVALATGTATLAVISGAAVVIVQFLIGYLWASRKAEAGAIAGALVTVGVAVYTAAVLNQPAIFNDATVTAALTYLVTMVLSLALPPRQP